MKMRNEPKIFFVLLCVFICGRIYAQEFGFGFGDDDAVSTGSANKSFSVSIGGEVSASLLGFVDDFSEGTDIVSLGDIFSGKLNFSAGTSFAEGVINLDFETSPSPVSINEAYVRAYFGGLEIEGGLRKLTWGKADSFGPLDVINPLDYSDLSNLSDPMNQKIARPLIHVSYRIGSFSKIQGVFVPTFEPMRYAPKDSRWAPDQVKQLDDLPNRVKDQIQTQVQAQLQPIRQILNMYNIPSPTVTTPKVKKHEPDISTLTYAQAGIRFTTTIGPADIGLQYYYGRLTRPAVTGDTTITISEYTPIPSIPGLPPGIPSQIPKTIDAQVDLNYAYNPYHQIGVDWAQVLAGFNIRAELAANITEDSKGDNGGVYNPALLWSFGFDRNLVWGINLNFQLNESVRLMNDKINKTQPDTQLPDIEADTDATSTRIIAALSKKFLRDELELRFATLWGIEDRDFLLMPALIWTRDTVSVELSCGIFGGNKEGQFGQYNKNSFIKAALTYSF